MKIKLTSVPVTDQAKAESFYTGILGFVKKHDVPVGEFRWLTVVSPEEPDAAELLLEPMGFEPSKAYYRALHDSGIPAASFQVENLQAEHERLTGLGVVFTLPPTEMGPVAIAVLDDTCGNLIQLQQLL